MACSFAARLADSWRIAVFYINNFGPGEYIPALETALKGIRDSNTDQFTVSVDPTAATTYNHQLAELKAALRRGSASYPKSLSFKSKMILFFVLRLGCVAAACCGWGGRAVLAMLALQFVVLPFSLVISVMLWHILGTKFVKMAVATTVLSAAIPTAATITLEVTTATAVGFLAIDQLICFACTFKTPRADGVRSTAPMPAWELAKHVGFGFLNCKTYTLIILLLARGFKLNLTIWVLDMVLGITPKLLHFFDTKVRLRKCRISLPLSSPITTQYQPALNERRTWRVATGGYVVLASSG